ncbi:MAG: AtpZ/AtpI family protein [Blastocatellia bacterium]|nr:AtpZ/AtpI family protein [Blastocatellia bacterium]
MGTDKKPPNDISWKSALMLSGIALSIPGTIIVPALIGYLIDKKFGSGSTYLLVGFVIGLVGAATEVFLLLRRMNQEE